MSSENKNEMGEKFIERSMYEGKSSKNPMLPLLGNLALAVGILAFGIYYYLELTQWEKEGGTIKMNRFIKLLYEMGGSITVLLLLWDQHFILFMKDTAVIRTKKENK